MHDKDRFTHHFSQIAQNAFHSSTMVGENFEIYSSQMAKNALKMCDLQTLKCKK